MKKHSAISKLTEKKSFISTARGAIVHVLIFGVISMTGHVATSTLSASVGAAGASMVPPISSFVQI